MSNIMQKPNPALFQPPRQDVTVKRSLNREQRRRDLIKITMEN